MKPSDLLGMATKIYDLFAHANMVADIAGAVIGKEPPLSDGDKPKHIGWSSLFGHSDEIAITKLLAELAENDPEGREIFLRFMAKKFPSGKTWATKYANFRAGNAFRSFVINLGHTPSRQYKVNETVTKKKDEEVIKVEWGLNPPGVNHSLEFVKNCLRTIRAAPSEAKGFNLLMEELRAMNVPTQSNDLDETVKAVTAGVESSLTDLDRWLEEQVANQHRNRSIIRIIYDKFL